MKNITFSLLLVLLTACGGNNSNSDSSQQVATVPPPEAEAGVQPGQRCLMQQRLYNNLPEYCQHLASDIRLQACSSPAYVDAYRRYCNNGGNRGGGGGRHWRR